MVKCAAQLCVALLLCRKLSYRRRVLKPHSFDSLTMTEFSAEALKAAADAARSAPADSISPSNPRSSAAGFIGTKGLGFSVVRCSSSLDPTTSELTEVIGLLTDDRTVEPLIRLAKPFLFSEPPYLLLTRTAMHAIVVALCTVARCMDLLLAPMDAKGTTAIAQADREAWDKHNPAFIAGLLLQSISALPNAPSLSSPTSPTTAAVIAVISGGTAGPVSTQMLSDTELSACDPPELREYPYLASWLHPMPADRVKPLINDLLTYLLEPSYAHACRVVLPSLQTIRSNEVEAAPRVPHAITGVLEYDFSAPMQLSMRLPSRTYLYASFCTRTNTFLYGTKAFLYTFFN